jgi:putative ABC transport system substrate-binding protein
MRRREFIATLSGAVAHATWPHLSFAQQPAMPVIGFLVSSAEEPAVAFVAAFRQGLKETGFVEGQNVKVEYRFADGKIDRLPEMAADLVRRNVAVIFAGGGGVTARLAKAETSTIPIVFVHGEDPVRIGLVEHLNRPGGNITGVTFFTVELGPKRLELLREMVPKAIRIALLVNPNSTNADNRASVALLQAAVLSSGQEPLVVNAGVVEDFATAFGRVVETRADALLVISDPLFTTRREQLIELAAHNRVPVFYPLREYVTSGGLASYGASITDAWRQTGMYVGRILKGEKPADLPVIQPTKFEFAINMKTAKVLGLDIQPTLLALADAVVE